LLCAACVKKARCDPKAAAVLETADILREMDFLSTSEDERLNHVEERFAEEMREILPPLPGRQHGPRSMVRFADNHFRSRRLSIEQLTAIGDCEDKLIAACDDVFDDVMARHTTNG
jgi:hypothetical protein